MSDRRWDLARIVEGVSGTVDMTLELVVRFDYGSIVPWVRRVDGSLLMTAGPDSLEFKPSRWIAEGSTVGNGNLIIPAKGTFLPWSGGPRVCPGQKMSQVEFVSVLATIFRSCSIAPALAEGESHEQGKKRLQNVIAKSRPALTLQMTSPEQVKLRWSKR